MAWWPRPLGQCRRQHPYGPCQPQKRGHGLLAPPQPCPRCSAHRALLRELGSSELWWWIQGKGSGPNPAWGPMPWGGIMERAWGPGAMGSPLVSQSPSACAGQNLRPLNSVSKTTITMGPHALSPPPHPALTPDPAKYTAALGLLPALCSLPGSPYFSGLCANMGSARPTLATQFRIGPPSFFYSRASLPETHDNFTSLLVSVSLTRTCAP